MNRRGIAVATGAVEDDEDPLETAKRELKEELGIEAKKWIPLGTMERIPSFLISTAFFS